MVDLDRILVTGATGFLGRHTVRVLNDRYGSEHVFAVNSRHYDLMDRGQIHKMFQDIRPTAVVHLAAYSGGIGANRTYPADFYLRNTLLTALMFEAAAHFKVGKLLYPMGGCSYPARAASPIGEDQLWNGYPQPESAPYSTAKMMGVVAARAYRQQHGLNASVIIPGNLYGEYDNFHPLDSHVIPATIRRFHEARLQGVDCITQWGSGKPTRDFVYAGDVAALIPFFLESFDEVGPVNISSGTETSIRELAETVAEFTGYAGRIEWDTGKPDGQMVKIFDTARLSSLGLSCPTPLADGLRRTIDWFATHYADRGDGLRL
ncbi:GDP-L-fucose synthase family protein [Azospirillum palustre]